MPPFWRSSYDFNSPDRDWSTINYSTWPWPHACTASVTAAKTRTHNVTSGWSCIIANKSFRVALLRIADCSITLSWSNYALRLHEEQQSIFISINFTRALSIRLIWNIQFYNTHLMTPVVRYKSTIIRLSSNCRWLLILTSVVSVHVFYCLSLRESGHGVISMRSETVIKCEFTYLILNITAILPRDLYEIFLNLFFYR
jgi:hypothetical protein